MRKGSVLAGDLEHEGRRLTGAFHLSEDEAALRAFRTREQTSMPLLNVTRGRQIFRGPIFKRKYVDDPSYGVPYVSSNDFDRVFTEPV